MQILRVSDPRDIPALRRFERGRVLQGAETVYAWKMDEEWLSSSGQNTSIRVAAFRLRQEDVPRKAFRRSWIANYTG